MKKQEAIDRIHEDLRARPEMMDLCLAIVDYLSVKPPAALQRVSTGLLRQATGAEDMKAILPAIQYLTGSRLNLLQPQFVFIQGDYEEEVPLEVVAEARATRKFYHPDRGELVPDFENLLHIYFTVGADAADFAGSQSK